MPFKPGDITIDLTGTPEGRMAMAREVLTMIERNLKAHDAEGRTVTSAGLSPVIHSEALAVVRESGQSARIANLDLVKAAGMPPESAFLLRGRYIVGILTFGRD
jgi:hypothetical protein